MPRLRYRICYILFGGHHYIFLPVFPILGWYCSKLRLFLVDVPGESIPMDLGPEFTPEVPPDPLCLTVMDKPSTILSNSVQARIGKPIIIGYNRDVYGTRTMGALVILLEADTAQPTDSQTKAPQSL